MKKLIYLPIFFVAFLALTSFAPGGEKEYELKWYTWNEGYAKAEKQKKIVLVDVYTEWCGWCKRMDKDTYTKKQIIDYINKEFVPVKLNPELDGKYNVDTFKLSGEQLFNTLTNNKNTGYPTIIFIYPKERQITLFPGYQDAEKFKTTLEGVVANHPGKKKKKED
ncbi:MAG: DUF255 domain-containing protein [Bacteroidetes bacterium]|nr:DUF255 domain-containing protein [Bacteroidota bacterium]